MLEEVLAKIYKMDLSRFTIIGEKDRLSTLRLQNARLIKLRWLYISLLPAIAAASTFFVGQGEGALKFIIIGLIGLAINGIFFAANKMVRQNIRYLQTLMLLQLALDLTIATFVTYQQGGIHARTAILFAIPIVAAGLIFKSAIVYLTAAVSGIGYAFSVFFYNSHNDLPIYESELLVPMVFYPALFLIMALLVIYLARVSIEETREQAYDAFLALLSHQLKHPASTVNAIVDQLEHEELSETGHDKHKKYIQILKTENRNLLHLLNNLLETATPAAYINRYDQVDLPKLLEKVSRQSAESYSRTADLRLKLSDMSLTVDAHGEKLITSLVNVINNAFQYSKAGTPVIVSLRDAKSNVIITIEDHGRGMDKQAKKQLFTKYSMHEEAGEYIEGLGLGLFVANKVIKAHRGSMHVISDKSGTKVIITLKKGKKA